MSILNGVPLPINIDVVVAQAEARLEAAYAAQDAVRHVIHDTDTATDILVDQAAVIAHEIQQNRATVCA